MNKIHSKVWNKELGQLVVASELARSDSAGVVQGAAAGPSLRRSLLAIVVAPMLALAGSVAFAQDWTVTDGATPAVIGDGGTVSVQGDANINVEQTGSDGAAVLEISLDSDLVVDSVTANTVTTGSTVMDNSGVAVGANVMLGSSGLVITGGPSVTIAGINAGNQVITGVAAGTASDHAVNLGQLDAVRATASAGWSISAEGGAAATVGSGGSVDFSGDGNIEITRTGTDLVFSLGDGIAVDSVSVGGMTLDVNGIDAGGKVITNLANGEISETSTDAVTGQQVHDLFFEGGTAFGVRYFRANSFAPDAEALGAEAIAIGPVTMAEGDSSFAAGDGAVTSEAAEGAIALGQGAAAGDLLSGEAAIAIGRGSSAIGNGATAVGDGASAGGGGATAVGAGAAAGGVSGIAVGHDAVAAAQNNISIGTAAGQGTGQVLPGDQSHNIAIGAAAGQNVAGQFNVALGDGAGSGVDGDNNLALGRGAGVGLTGTENVSIGLNANAGATSNRAVGIGENSSAETEGIAIGFDSSAGNTGIAVGRQTTALGTGTAIGPNAHADSNFVALGLNSWATRDDVAGDSAFTNRPFSGSAVSVGSSQPGSEFTRRIVNVEDGAQDTDAVNVRQLRQAVSGIDLSDINFADGVITNLQDQIDRNMLHYVSINDGGVDKGNKDNNGADAAAIDSIAIGPDATTKNRDSIAIGHHAGAEGDSAVVLGHNIKGLGTNSTTIGNSQSEARDESGIAIGTHVVSRDENSIVIGRDSYTNRQAGGPSVGNSIVIGTSSSSTAVEGIVIGKDSVVNAPRGIAQGSAANATASDATASGTRAFASGARAQASGTDARAGGIDSIATGTRAHGMAAHGVAIGTDAVAGFTPPPGEEGRNSHSVAIGAFAHAVEQDALAVGRGAAATEQDAASFGRQANASARNALALGRQAQASALGATAIGRQATASDMNALAAGTGAVASATGASAFGQGAQASHARSVALGAGAATAAAQGTAGITIDGINYVYAGTTPGATVSVGAAGDERTITNVAAGRVNAGSTDAINGSQLFRTNQAVEALAGNLDTAGGSVAVVLGGDANYDPVTHQVTMTNVGGTGEDTVHEAIEYAAQGWDVSAAGGATENVAPGGTVDFSSSDANIDITRTGTNLEFALADEVEVNTSITVGDTVIDGDGVQVGDDVHLGDTGLVIDGGPGVTVDGIDAGGEVITNVAAGEVSATSLDAINGSQLFGVSDSVSIAIGGNTVVNPDGSITTSDIGNTGHHNIHDAIDAVNTAANAGWNVTGSGADEVNIGPDGSVDFQGDGNISVAQTGADDAGVVAITLNEDVDLGVDGSVAIGDSVLDNAGLEIDDGAGNVTTVAAGGTTVTDGTATTSIGAGVVTVVGGASTIVVDGNAGTIGGLTNTTFDPANIASGQAATEDQLLQVHDLAAAGWTILDADGNQANIGPNGELTFIAGNGNLAVELSDDTDDAGVMEITLADNIELTEDGSVAIGDGTDGSTLDAGGLEVVDGSNVTTVDAGSISVTDAGGTTAIGGNVVSVGGANPIVISGNTGTIGGLANTTFDPDDFTSGQAATEDQLKQVSDIANAGWNVSVDGEGAVADNNVGPGGTVDFSNADGNIDIVRDGTDLVFDLADDVTVDSVTAGDTYIDATGVAIGADVHLGNTGLVITGGPSVTVGGIDAGGLVITNVAAGEVSATSTDAINGSQLFGMGDSMVTVIGGNATLNPDGTITTSNIGGTGHDNIDDAIRAANDAANAGWTATDAAGNDANIGPNGSVTFTGDGNINVAQTGDDNSGQVEITLSRDLDVDSITAGNTVIDADGVRVGDDVHLGDTGLVIEGGPNVTTDGIDAGGQVISNVAAGVEDTDAANVGQVRQVAADVVDLGDRMDVVEGDLADLQAGATGPFQVSQEAPIVAPTPTGANSAAGGSGADASGDNATALGNQAVASGANSTAVGQGAQATHDNSVALGQGSATTVGAQAGYDAAYVGNSDSAGEVNVGNRTVSGVAPGVAGNDAVNVNQLNAGVNHAVVTANEYTDQRFNQVQNDVWHLHGRVDELEKDINAGVATAMAMRQAPYVAGATTYYAGFGAYKDQGALGVSLRRTADNGRWSLEGGFSANRDGAGGYIGVSGVLGGK